MKCKYCQRSTSKKVDQYDPLYQTKDHFVPQSMGGSGLGNIVIACRACNEMKGDMTPRQWEEFCEGVGGWWSLYRVVRWRGQRLYEHLPTLVDAMGNKD